MNHRLATALAIVALAASACSRTPTTGSAQWAPKPRSVDGLSVLADADADGFHLHTAGGTRSFLTGVNLGSTTPLHQPGEVGSIPAGQYRRWISRMASMGIRTVRVYTLLPPAFYGELRRHNEAHASDPIYLVQGVYLPDESYIEPGHTLYDTNVDDAFTREIADISAAVHGDFTRPPTRGRASGRYTTDVSPWLAGWIIGVEWDGAATLRTDRKMKDVPTYHGRYFAATDDASATESWLARHLDGLATAEAKRGDSMPIAFANWPTADPLKHPTEPLQREDLVGVDAMHVLPTAAWPGGTFASFHAYPYYPDFQRYEPGLAKVSWRDRPDRYAGYLTSLRDHYAARMPLLITEFGVPSSLGSAHIGPLGRDQGGHTEREAMAMDADMLRLIAHLKLGGAFVFSWEDEWFKQTWNTAEHQLTSRRQLWHDPLTNEEWFGMVATDPQPLPDATVENTYANGRLKYAYVWADASWVHFEFAFRSTAPSRFTVEADVVPGKATADYRVNVTRSSATLEVRKALDPIRLDTHDRPYRPDADKAWHTYALFTNRAYDRGTRHDPAEFQEVGRLVRGTTWTREGASITLKLPWSMLGLADPSSRTALGEGTPAKFVKVPGITFTYVSGASKVKQKFVWSTWNHTTYRERPKKGVDVLTKAMRELAH